MKKLPELKNGMVVEYHNHFYLFLEKFDTRYGDTFIDFSDGGWLYRHQIKSEQITRVWDNIPLVSMRISGGEPPDDSLIYTKQKEPAYKEPFKISLTKEDWIEFQERMINNNIGWTSGGKKVIEETPEMCVFFYGDYLTRGSMSHFDEHENPEVDMDYIREMYDKPNPICTLDGVDYSEETLRSLIKKATA